MIKQRKNPDNRTGMRVNMNEQAFESVTIFVLASNETALLEETVADIRRYCPDGDLEKIVIVLKSRDCPAYGTAKKLSDKCADGKIEPYLQKAKTLESCIAEIPSLVKSSHFITMASDMEMSPAAISTFVKKAKKYPGRIICASKWLKDSVVEGYGGFHEFGSRMLNIVLSFLIGRKASDTVSLYQIYPYSIYRKMDFRNADTFVYEYTIKPLCFGVEYEEIPTVYRKRTEGKTSYNYLNLFEAAVRMVVAAVKFRFQSLCDKQPVYDETR